LAQTEIADELSLQTVITNYQELSFSTLNSFVPSIDKAIENSDVLILQRKSPD